MSFAELLRIVREYINLAEGGNKPECCLCNTLPMGAQLYFSQII